MGKSLDRLPYLRRRELGSSCQGLAQDCGRHPSDVEGSATTGRPTAEGAQIRSGGGSSRYRGRITAGGTPPKLPGGSPNQPSPPPRCPPPPPPPPGPAPGGGGHGGGGLGEGGGGEPLHPEPVGVPERAAVGPQADGAGQDQLRHPGRLGGGQLGAEHPAEGVADDGDGAAAEVEGV